MGDIREAGILAKNEAKNHGNAIVHTFGMNFRDPDVALKLVLKYFAHLDELPSLMADTIPYICKKIVPDMPQDVWEKLFEPTDVQPAMMAAHEAGDSPKIDGKRAMLNDEQLDAALTAFKKEALQ